MSEHHHPMRGAVIHVFARHDDSPKGARFIARLYPYDVYPMFWHGASAEEAISAAEGFRVDAIAKHEAAFISRAIAVQKAKEARAKKEAAE